MTIETFFERILPPRPQAYFEFSSFESLMQDILKEQVAGECAMFIIRNDEEKNDWSDQLQHHKKSEMMILLQK